MAEYPTLHTQRRTLRGKKVSQLRRQGLTPIVVYGAKTDNLALQVETRELLRVLSEAGGTQLVAIQVEGESRPRLALAREVQRHVTRLTPLHADFLEVDVTQRISSEVPILIQGEPRLVRQKVAMVQNPLTSVTVEALPGSLPSAITVDATRLVDIDDAIYVRDLEVAGEARILTDPDELVARLTHARAKEVEVVAEEEVEAAEAEEAAAEEAAEAGAAGRDDSAEGTAEGH